MPDYTTSDPHVATRPSVQFRERVFSGLRTGALDMLVSGRRVISLPSQLGCAVGCSFCVSSQAPLSRNLRAEEMLSLVRACLDYQPLDGQPIELSFTGEGEPLHNWRQTRQVIQALPRLSPDFRAVRYSFSGLGASRLLARAAPSRYPTRLQFSLHAARQSIRSQLIPHSEPLRQIELALLAHQHRFSGVELNVVLQDGINDSDDDLEALCHWGLPEWPILLNPLLGPLTARVAQRTGHFEHHLRAAGRQVKCYHQVAASLSQKKIYPLLAAHR